MNNKKGFTLIELIVVIAILGVLALILVPGFMGYIDDARTSAAQSNARNLLTAAQAEAQKSLLGGANISNLNSGAVVSSACAKLGGEFDAAKGSIIFDSKGNVKEAFYKKDGSDEWISHKKKA